jgi:ABC-type uncharacterized transport system permease subunit
VKGKKLERDLLRRVYRMTRPYRAALIGFLVVVILGAVLGAIPPQVFAALPYIVTIIVLAGVVGRSIPPAADGQPYERETTTR